MLSRRTIGAATVLCTLLTLNLPAQVDDPAKDAPPPDPIAAGIASAEAAFEEADRKSAAELGAALEAIIREQAAGGDLDHVKALMQQKKAFESDGTHPTHDVFAEAVAKHDAQTGVAAARLAEVYRAAVKRYTQSLAIESAEQAQAKLRALEAKYPPPLPDDGPIALIPLIRPEQHTVEGAWAIEGGELRKLDAQRGGNLRIPLRPTGDYDLAITLTRVAGGNDVNFYLPVGPSMTMLQMGGADGRDDGFSSTPDRKPHALVTNKKHRVLIQVRLTGDDAGTIDVSVDGKKHLAWRGRVSELKMTDWRLPDPPSLGLAGNRVVIHYHAIELRRVSGRIERIK